MISFRGLNTDRTVTYKPGQADLAKGRETLAKVQEKVLATRDVFVSADNTGDDLDKAPETVALQDASIGEDFFTGGLSQAGFYGAQHNGHLHSGRLADITALKRNEDGSTSYLEAKDLGGSMARPFYTMVTESQNGTLMVETGSPSLEFLQQFVGQQDSFPSPVMKRDMERKKQQAAFSEARPSAAVTDQTQSPTPELPKRPSGIGSSSLWSKLATRSDNT